MEEVRYRPAVRIICLDARSRVLLLCWRDPYDDSLVWEPPGGGIEPGETPFAAARRELVEETGLSSAAIGATFVEVERDVRWNGFRFGGAEQFFLARYGTDAPELRRDGLMADEQVNLQGHGWLAHDELGALDGRLEPPHLASVISELDPAGRWAG